jgi:hypothetical protein
MRKFKEDFSSVIRAMVDSRDRDREAGIRHYRVGSFLCINLYHRLPNDFW